MSQDFAIPISDSNAISASLDPLNDAFQALDSKFSGTTAPSTTRAFQWWLDSTASTEKLNIRNPGDTAWLEIGPIEANFGHLRIDGSNAMTSDLDLDGNDILLDVNADSKLLNDVADELGIQLNGTEEYRFSATELKLNGNDLATDADDDSKLLNGTDDEIGIQLAGAEEYRFKATQLEMNGNDLATDADDDSKLLFGTDDEIGIQLSGAEEYRFTATFFDMNGNPIRDYPTAGTVSGSLPTPTKAMIVENNAGTQFFIPFFTSADPWTA